jgi:hypothetical protein
MIAIMCQIGDQGQDQHECRHAHHDLDDAADQHVHPPTEVPGNAAHRDADD